MGRGRPPPRDNRKELARKRKRQFYKNAKLIQKYRSVREKKHFNQASNAEDGNAAHSDSGSSEGISSSGSQAPVDFYEATFGDSSSSRYRFDATSRASNAWEDDSDYHATRDANTRSDESQKSGQKFKPLSRKANLQRSSRPNPFKKQLSKQEERKRLKLQQLEEDAQKKIRLAQSLKQRKKKAKKMSRRSRHGQPVMENHIDQILTKLQKRR